MERREVDRRERGRDRETLENWMKVTTIIAKSLLLSFSPSLLLSLSLSLLLSVFCVLLHSQAHNVQTPSPSPTPACFPSRPISIDHWRGEYFNNRDLQGAPVMVRDDDIGNLDFDWGLGTP